MAAPWAATQTAKAGGATSLDASMSARTRGNFERVRKAELLGRADLGRSAPKGRGRGGETRRQATATGRLQQERRFETVCAKMARQAPSRVDPSRARTPLCSEQCRWLRGCFGVRCRRSAPPGPPLRVTLAQAACSGAVQQDTLCFLS